MSRSNIRGKAVMTLAALSALACLSAHAADSDDIRHIEQGLRPAVALAGKPVPTATLEAEMQRLHVPGVSIAVIRDGKIAWARGYGVAVKDGGPVTPDTLFQAASISKPVAAFAALRMVEAGRLALDADINTALTTWKLPPGPKGEHATLRQLLSHTAGTTVSGFPGYAHDARVPSVIQVLDGAPPANTKPVRIETAPGSAWNYSGGGYTVVQQAMMDAGEKPFGDLVAWSVLAPLGMASSTFGQPLPAALLPRAAMPHDAKGEPYQGGPYTYPELAAAGLWTTASDLARFAIGVQRTAKGQQPPESGLVMLPPELASAMLTPVKNDYALGFEIGGKGADRSFAHGGSNMGFQNSLYAHVERGDGIVVMTNGDAGAELAQSIVRAAAFEYHWPGRQTAMRKAVTLPAAKRKALAGTYEIKGLGTFEIADRNGQLMLGIREGVVEPLYAAADAPGVLFVLSRELELRMAKNGSASGRLLSGSFDVRFKKK